MTTDLRIIVFEFIPVYQTHQGHSFVGPRNRAVHSLVECNRWHWRLRHVRPEVAVEEERYVSRLDQRDNHGKAICHTSSTVTDA